MTPHLTKAIADTSTLGAVSIGTSAYVGFFQNLALYATPIASICSVIFGIIGAVFYVLNYKKNSKSDDNTLALYKLDTKLDNHIETNNKLLASILVKLELENEQH